MVDVTLTAVYHGTLFMQSDQLSNCAGSILL